ncbi:MAG: toxin-activating lysine-acyltransferase [Caulobacterales bacterium]
MGLFGKKSKEPEAPVSKAEPVAPARAPEPRAPEPRAPEPQAAAPTPAPAPEVRQPEPPAPKPAPVSAAPAPQAAPAGPPLSQQEVEKAVGESQQAMLAVGHMMTFLMNSEDIKNTTLQQARSIVWPAVTNQQFLVAMAQSNKTGHITPIGLALWANVSDEIDARLERDLDQPFNLGQTDWNSGQHTWLIMLAGDNRAIVPMVADMQKSRMGGRPMKMRVPDGDGKAKVTLFEYDPSQLAAAN